MSAGPLICFLRKLQPLEVSVITAYQYGWQTFTERFGEKLYESFQHINSTLSMFLWAWFYSESCPAASPKWPHFSTWQSFCQTSHSSNITKSISKEVKAENQGFVVQPCKLNFSLARFLNIPPAASRTLWSALIVCPSLSSASLQAKS